MKALQETLQKVTRLNVLVFAAASLLAPILMAGNAEANTAKPGPSADLFNNPYYACTKNYYVSLTGNDSNAGTATATAWQTLQHANDHLPTGGAAAGTCINVEPGTYAHGVSLTAGGTTASSTGYVVYRCTTLDACTITDTSAGGGNGAFVFNPAQPMTANYVMIDGFKLSAASKTLYGQGVQLANSTNGFTPSVHHVWILNSIISGYGQSGIQMNEGEYFFVVHNTIYGNSNVGCSAQGSGISFNILIAKSGYTPTHDDLSNKVYGTIGSDMHNVVAWNVVHNNALTSCGSASNPYDTDGNNIIMDTLSWHNIQGGQPYLPGTLIAFNIVYNSGGGGIHMLWSENITVANNTCFNSYLDPYNNGSDRACIDASQTYSSTIINNIAVAIPVAPNGTCAYNVAPYAQFNSATLGAPPSGTPVNTWSHNLTKLLGRDNNCYGVLANDSTTGENPSYEPDHFLCSANKCSTDPAWVSVGKRIVGTETVAPSLANFALQSSSPAIGYGLTKGYLPATSVDAGACYHTLTSCP